MQCEFVYIAATLIVTTDKLRQFGFPGYPPAPMLPRRSNRHTKDYINHMTPLNMTHSASTKTLQPPRSKSSKLDKGKTAAGLKEEVEEDTTKEVEIDNAKGDGDPRSYGTSFRDTDRSGYESGSDDSKTTSVTKQRPITSCISTNASTFPEVLDAPSAPSGEACEESPTRRKLDEYTENKYEGLANLLQTSSAQSQSTLDAQIGAQFKGPTNNATLRIPGLTLSAPSPPAASKSRLSTAGTDSTNDKLDYTFESPSAPYRDHASSGNDADDELDGNYSDDAETVIDQQDPSALNQDDAGLGAALGKIGLGKRKAHVDEGSDKENGDNAVQSSIGRQSTTNAGILLISKDHTTSNVEKGASAKRQKQAESIKGDLTEDMGEEEGLTLELGAGTSEDV